MTGRPERAAADKAGAAGDVVIDVADLQVTYVTGLRRKRVRAVRDCSFQVRRGEVFGFLGPNGAGKTTTIRVLMGLVRATAGRCRVFGQSIEERDARRRIGFLPEAPYFYDYLTAEELCDLAGRLFGLPRAARRARARELLDLVGLAHARGRPMKKFSKGMLQRAGIAQALINDPEVVVFDEPMSGLDPIGRKEVRDIILGLRDQGKTVFFSTHILPDVELICDRVAIIVQGAVRAVGALSEIVAEQAIGVEIAFRVTDAFGDDQFERLCQRAPSARRVDRNVAVSLSADADVDEFLAFARDLGLSVVSVTPKHETLEDVFLEQARGKEATR
ncbi:MAG: ABC transporter ATP-binding protein [Deltaproteobacteria bacterium]|nr:MAG: ABC transporter ATP-binding protein [Deltaproteobacteria bacterium]